jgi:hypothetical protein
MSLTQLHWRYVGEGAISAATQAAAMDALYTLGTSSTYADGSARSAGTAKAWTWNRYQSGGTTEAVRAQPPSATDTLSFRFILAGRSTAATPTMAGSDTYQTTMLHASIAKNAGAYNAWDAAAPFTSGQFFGYWRAVPVTTNTWGKVRLYECEEGINIEYITSGGNKYWIRACGDDPETPDTTLDGETDGRLYTLSVTGTTNPVQQGIWSPASAGSYQHNSVNGGCHFGAFTPGSGTIKTMSQMLTATSVITATGLRSPSGYYLRAPIHMRSTAAAPDDRFLCRLRETMMTADVLDLAVQTTSAGAVTVGYALGYSGTTSGDSVFLRY